MEILSKNEAETGKIAVSLANEIKPGDVLMLRGDLGAGKSVFARALLRQLMSEPGLEVPSPTFTLVQTYDTPKGLLYHFDLYRLKEPDEIYEIGWEEALAEGITLVEWPERLGNLTPKTYIDISIQAHPQGRSIKVTYHD